MTHIHTPHFNWPFRLAANGASIRTVDSESDQDIDNSVMVLLSTHLGERLDNPDYGVEEQVFIEGGADLQHLSEAIARWEPRVQIDVDSVEFADMVESIRIAIHERSNG